MKRTLALLGLLVALASPLPTHAVIVTPDLIDLTGRLTFQGDPPAYVFTDDYATFGLIFGPGQVAAFSDPPVAWAGVNSAGIVDFLAPIDGFFVVPGSATNAVTTTVTVEVGLARTVGTLQLDVFDINGLLIGTDLNSGLSDGPHGRDLASVTIPGIHSFRVSLTPLGETPDAAGDKDFWGMPQISFSAPVAIPFPGTLVLLVVGGIVAAVGARRVRPSKKQTQRE